MPTKGKAGASEKAGITDTGALGATGTGKIKQNYNPGTIQNLEILLWDIRFAHTQMR